MDTNVVWELVKIIGGTVVILIGVGLFIKYSGLGDVFGSLMHIIKEFFDSIRTFLITLVQSSPAIVKMIFFILLFFLVAAPVFNYTFGLTKVCSATPNSDGSANLYDMDLLNGFAYKILPSNLGDLDNIENVTLEYETGSIVSSRTKAPTSELNKLGLIKNLGGIYILALADDIGDDYLYTADDNYNMRICHNKDKGCYLDTQGCGLSEDFVALITYGYHTSATEVSYPGSIKIIIENGKWNLDEICNDTDGYQIQYMGLTGYIDPMSMQWRYMKSDWEKLYGVQFLSDSTLYFFRSNETVDVIRSDTISKYASTREQFLRNGAFKKVSYTDSDILSFTCNCAKTSGGKCSEYSSDAEIELFGIKVFDVETMAMIVGAICVIGLIAWLKKSF